MEPPGPSQRRRLEHVERGEHRGQPIGDGRLAAIQGVHRRAHAVGIPGGRDPGVGGEDGVDGGGVPGIDGGKQVGGGHRDLQILSCAN